MTGISGFIAYPAVPSDIGRSIEGAVQQLVNDFGVEGFETWRETDIAGRFISSEILSKIEARDCLVADVTEPNFNVTYEIGFALGKQKRVLLVKQRQLNDGDGLEEIGIFDTLGYRNYENSSQLVELLRKLNDIEAIHLPSVKSNSKAPVYLIEAPYKTDSVTRIIARVKKARLFFRSFDPNEQPRLSAFEAIQQVAQSYGVLLHLLPTRIQGSRIHNLRVSFLAGLAAGMGRVLLILQEGDEPVPIDYRDLVAPFYHLPQIDEAIAEFATRVTEALQSGVERPIAEGESLLASLNLGSSSAENELRDLADYYLEIDAYQRAVRGDARIVVGRKGSGKTALFAQLRDRVRGPGANVVLDLKPEGYKLLKFKEDVLNLLELGTVEHTITAFWEYLLLLEVCRKILEKDGVRHTRDTRIFEPYRRLASLYEADEYVSEGDFSERMSTLLQRIRQDFDARYGTPGMGRLSQAELTELLYRHDVAGLRQEVIAYMRFKDSLWLLFDNLDKGWPTHGVEAEDLVIIRSLTEAARKIERELSSRGVEAHTVIFLRNDVFELLVQETSDRGKETKVAVDWTDGDLLRELIRRRLIFNGLEKDRSFDDLWRLLCVSHVNGEESFQFLVDRCLMRPRALIDLINHCRSCAVNLGHQRIEQDDVRKGWALFSTDLVFEIGLEIRDVFPEVEDVLYAFIDAPSRFPEKMLREMLTSVGVRAEIQARLIDILLWYGVLGLVSVDGEVEYIHSLNYDVRLMRGKLRRLGEGAAAFAVSPAFWPGLGIRPR
jgi:hypothetical protein